MRLAPIFPNQKELVSFTSELYITELVVGTVDTDSDVYAVYSLGGYDVNANFYFNDSIYIDETFSLEYKFGLPEGFSGFNTIPTFTDSVHNLHELAPCYGLLYTVSFDDENFVMKRCTEISAYVFTSSLVSETYKDKRVHQYNTYSDQGVKITIGTIQESYTCMPYASADVTRRFLIPPFPRAGYHINGQTQQFQSRFPGDISSAVLWNVNNHLTKAFEASDLSADIYYIDDTGQTVYTSIPAVVGNSAFALLQFPYYTTFCGEVRY